MHTNTILEAFSTSEDFGTDFIDKGNKKKRNIGDWLNIVKCE